MEYPAELDPMQDVPLEHRKWIKPERSGIGEVTWKTPDIYFSIIMFAVCEFMLLRLIVPLRYGLSFNVVVYVAAAAIGLLLHLISSIRAVLAYNELFWQGSQEDYWSARIDPIEEGSPAEKLLVTARNALMAGHMRIYYVVFLLGAALTRCVEKAH